MNAMRSGFSRIKAAGKFRAAAFLCATLALPPVVNAQAPSPRAINLNSSRSNVPHNSIISDGMNCTADDVATDGNGNVTRTSSTTVPCIVPNGQYDVPIFPTAGQVPAVVTVIPQFVDGASWQTTLGIVNTNASAATASVNCFQETAAGDTSTQAWAPPFTEGTNTQNLNLAAGASLFLDTPGTAATLSQGWCEVSASDGVQVYSKFTWSYSGGGQGIAPAVVSGTDIMIPFDNTKGSSTAIALANPTASAEAVMISFQLAGVQSPLTISQGGVTLQPNGHKAFLIPAQFPATAGQRGLAEFIVTPVSTTTGTTTPELSIIPLQFNAANNFTTAPAYPVNNGPVIGAADPLVCVINPTLAGCPNPPFYLLTMTVILAAQGAAPNPVVINITPGLNGTYDAALSGTLNGSPVSGSFVGGVLSVNPGLVIFNFNTPAQGSTFTSGSIGLALIDTGFDAATGIATGTAQGPMTLNQPGGFRGQVATTWTMFANTK